MTVIVSHFIVWFLNIFKTDDNVCVFVNLFNMSQRFKRISNTLANYNYDNILLNQIKMMITQNFVIDDDKYDALKMRIKQMLKDAKLLKIFLDDKTEKKNNEKDCHHHKYWTLTFIIKEKSSEIKKCLFNKINETSQ